MSQQRVHASQLARVVPGSNQRHTSLVQAVLHLLALNQIPAVPIHTGARVRPNPDGPGFQLLANAEQAGFSDIFACLPPEGRAWLIECKTGNAHARASQRRLHAHFERAGALITIPRSVDDVLAVIRRERPPPRRAHHIDHSSADGWSPANWRSRRLRDGGSDPTNHPRRSARTSWTNPTRPARSRPNSPRNANGDRSRRSRRAIRATGATSRETRDTET